MATTWTAQDLVYTVACADGVYSLFMTIEVGGENEADIDAGIQGFADAYNALHPVTAVTKAYGGTGVSDWSYMPSS